MNEDHLGLDKDIKIEIKKSHKHISKGSLIDAYGKSPIAQETHHAMHALSFFAFMIDRTLLGEPVKRHLLTRIVHHLMNLREFIEDKSLNELINDLCMNVQLIYAAHPLLPGALDENSQSRLNMNEWLAVHKVKILMFADYYGKTAVFEHPLPNQKGDKHEHKKDSGQ